jgi:hypothetical protein
VAQVSFHNCHVPSIGTPDDRRACAAGDSCNAPSTTGNASAYTDAELDFYGCMIELDRAIGKVMAVRAR